VSGRATGRLVGSVRWAVVPFAPAPPFRLYAGPGHEPITVPDRDLLIDAVRRGGDAELSYIVPGKARPVLLLTDPPVAHHQEVTALRLLRLSKLTAPEQQHVRERRDELLFHLAPERFDLPEESAAMVTALVRLHVDAIGSVPALGQLDEDELRVLGERIVTFYRFDTRRLLERQIEELVARRQARARTGGE
jgi:hypothetical protein